MWHHDWWKNFVDPHWCWMSRTGQPLGAALLAVVDVNGTPLFIPIAIGSFDPDGLWAVSGTVPAGLAGSVVTVRGFGIAPADRAEGTNPEAVIFQ